MDNHDIEKWWTSCHCDNPCTTDFWPSCWCAVLPYPLLSVAGYGWCCFCFFRCIHAMSVMLSLLSSTAAGLHWCDQFFTTNLVQSSGCRSDNHAVWKRCAQYGYRDIRWKKLLLHTTPSALFHASYRMLVAAFGMHNRCALIWKLVWND